MLIGCKKQILADTLDLSKYNTPGLAEMIGIEWGGVHWILYYTPNSNAALVLLQAIQQYKEDHPTARMVFIGDMNAHNSDWIISSSITDKAGLLAQEFCELFGLSQLVDFTTREGNTLDLVMSDIKGIAIEAPGFGNSDHKSMSIVFESQEKIPSTPERKAVRDWHNAPWNHIRGAVKRALTHWKPTGNQDDAEEELDAILSVIIEKYVKWKVPSQPGPTPWWNHKCEDAYKWKQQAFTNRIMDPEGYNQATKYNRKIQKKAYSAYQQKIKRKLNNLPSSDRNFWQMAKEIAGLEAPRSEAAPSPEELAVHFAEKMSNGKGIEADAYVAKDGLKIPLSSFKIRFKTVLKVLQNMNPNKSANGVPPIFWKECAHVVAPSVYKLFRYIVKKSKFISRWKIGRVSAPHKRGSVKLPKNYRPLKVLENIAVAFERVCHSQLYRWISKFTPVSQFGFVQGVGSKEYGCTLTFKMLSVLERRGEGILVSLDVKGAFDRVWWSRLKKKFEARGMTGRALELIKDYLFKRFLRVVCQGIASSTKEIFSGVPQGAVWSPNFWDFDIADLPDAVSAEGDDFCYADDCGIWYEITDDNRDVVVAIVNTDLERLIEWGRENMTTFEPEKTSYCIISRRKNPFDPYEASTGIRMGGLLVDRVDELKLVGYLFDSKLTFAGMVDKQARKARSRLAAVRRLKPMLDCSNIQLMYTMFVRSILEYGSVVYMGAAQSHLDKLDRVQDSAQRLGGFVVEPLQSRREAAALSLAFDLLDDKGYGELSTYKPTVYEPLALTKKRTRHAVEAGIQLKSNAKTSSLDQYRRGYLGSIDKIWAKVPQSLLREGQCKTWSKIKKRAKKFLVGKWVPSTHMPTSKHCKKTHNINDFRVYKTKLNNELNMQTDWAAIHKQYKDQGISITNNGQLTSIKM